MDNLNNVTPAHEIGWDDEISSEGGQLVLLEEGDYNFGCIVCPMSSAWWDGIVNDCYPDEMRELLSNVENYARATKPDSEVKKFIEQGGWKARMGGRGLQNGGNRVVEKIADDKISFSFVSKRQDWLQVCSILGPIVYRDNDIYTQLIDKQEFQFQISGEAKTVVTYWPYSKMDRFVLSHLRGIANKTAYCFGCKACEVQCPVNAFTITENGKIYIREDKCIHCCNCIEFTNGKGCLAAKSLSVTGGENGMDLKGMNRYQHFGLRRPWLEHFFEHKENCFTMGSLGTRQYDSLRVWLKEAGLLTATGKGAKSGVPTPLFNKVQPLGAGNPLTWAVIWTNLAYNSIISKWYMLNAPAGEIYEKNDEQWNAEKDMLAKRHHVLLKFRRRFGMRFCSFQTGVTAGLRSGWLLFELCLFIPLMTRILRSWISCRWTRQN